MNLSGVIKSVFRGHLADNIKAEVVTFTTKYIEDHKDATFAQVETAVNAAGSSLIRKGFSALPAMYQLLEPLLENYAIGWVDGKLQELYNEAVSKLSQSVAKAA